MSTITVKWMAFIAIALLILGTFSPVLQVRAQADDRRRDGDRNEASEPVLTEEEAILLALEFLRAEIGNNEFVVEKVQVDDGDYELRISDSEGRYEITLDGKTGEILDFEVKTDDDDEDADEEEEEANAPSITTPIISEDDAISAAVEALPGPFEEGVDIIERIQLNDDGNYKLRILHQGIEYDILIDGENAEVLKFTIRGNGNGPDNEKVENVDPSPLIQANDAIESALAYLLGIDPTKDYEVDSIKVDNGNYQIKLTDGEQKYELLIDGQNGEVLEFEVKGQDDEEEDDEDRERVDELLVTLGLQEAIQIALDFLEARDPDFSAKTYTVVEAELKGLKYRIEISVEGDQFEFDIDAKDGKITKFDEDRGEIEPQLIGEEAPAISAEEAIVAALAYLSAQDPDRDFIVEEIELDDGNYELKITDGERTYKIVIDGQEGQILELEVEERGRGRDEDVAQERRDGPPLITLDLSQAIQIALDFLQSSDPEFGSKGYVVEEAELKGLQYKIEIIEGENEFEFKIDATDGTILKYEAEIEDAELEIEGEDENELKIKVKGKGKGRDEVKNSFHIQVGKEQARLTTNFNIRENETKSQLELQLFFILLQEFVDDGNETGVLDANDTIVSTLNLNRLRWNVNRTEIFDENGKLVEILVIQNATGSMVDNIAFIYHFTPTTRNVTFADETVVSVRVWEIKFDIQISGFAWSANNTMLALSARFDSKFEVKSLGEAEVRFETVDRVTPFFNWGGSATGDGSEIEVGATVSERIVTLSYPYFEYELIHDPSIGYIVSSILEAIVLVPMIMAVGAVIAVTAVLGSSLLRQERLRKRLEESL